MRRPQLGQSGQTLIEIAIGMTILSVVLLAATSAAISSSQQGSAAQIDLVAASLAQEGVDQLVMYRNYCAAESPAYNTCVPIENWVSQNGGTSVLNASDFNLANWTLTGTTPTGPNVAYEDPFSPGRFTRSIQFTDVGDPDLKSVGFVEIECKVIVGWTNGNGAPQSVSDATVLTNWNGG